MAQQETVKQPDYRIGMVAAGFMVITAIVLDGVQILLAFTGVFVLASELITFIAGPLFGIWFFMLRVNYFGGKKALVKIMTAIMTMVVELIPVIDAMPSITIGTIIVINATRAEDREPTLKAAKK